MEMIRLIRTNVDCQCLPIDSKAGEYLIKEMRRLNPTVKYMKNDNTGVETLEIEKIFYNNHKGSFSLTGYRRM